MAFRRRSRRSARGAKRRLTWYSAGFAGKDVELSSGAGSDAFNGADVGCTWCKWPSGELAETLGSGVSVVTPSEETLERTLVGSNVTFELDGALQSTEPATFWFGIIAWDSMDPTHEDLAILQWPEIPHPGDGSLDWIFRIPFTFTKDNFQLAATTPIWTESRAKRKLPRATGLLMCVGVTDYINAQSSFNFSWQIEVRQLFKSGFYQA